MPLHFLHSNWGRDIQSSVYSILKVNRMWKSNHSKKAYQLNSCAMPCWWDLAIHIRRHTGLPHVSYIYTLVIHPAHFVLLIFSLMTSTCNMFQAFAFQTWGTLHVGGKGNWVKFLRLGCTAGRTRLWRCNPPPGSLETRDSWQLGPSFWLKALTLTLFLSQHDIVILWCLYIGLECDISPHTGIYTLFWTSLTFTLVVLDDSDGNW